jgi:hypothetical protein
MQLNPQTVYAEGRGGGVVVMKVEEGLMQAGETYSRCEPVMQDRALGLQSATVMFHGAARGKRQSTRRGGVDETVSQTLSRSPQHFGSTREYENGHQVVSNTLAAH